MVETKRITLADRQITYDFERKNVRNINIRIRPDGRVAVSAPHGCPMEKVRDFLHKSAPRILRALDKFNEKNETPRIPPSPKTPSEGALVQIFGKMYPMHILVGRIRRAELSEDTLLLYRRESDGDEAARRIFRDFCTALLQKEAERVIARYTPTFAGTGAASLKTLAFRSMRAAWGTCSKKNRLITLNLRLIYAPIEAIEAVVLHEMTHLLHPDHSKRFYAALTERMPDYQARMALLRQIDARAEDLF